MVKRLLLILIASSLFLTACDDDESTPDAPMVPNINQIRINTATFNAPVQDENAGAYNVAYSIVSALVEDAELVYFTFGQMLLPVANVNPTYSNDVFTWDYSGELTAFQGFENTSTTFDFKLTADISSATEVAWVLRVSGTFLGNALNEVPLLTGTSSYDTETGELTLDFGNEALGALYQILFGWQIEGGIVSTWNFNAKLISPATDVDVMVEYTITGNTATINLQSYNEDAGGYIPFVITWDTSTNAGSITSPAFQPQFGTSQLCWGANKLNAQCPS